MTTRPALIVDPEHGPELFEGDFGVITGYGSTWTTLNLVKALIEGGEWFGLKVTKVPFVRLVTADHLADVHERFRLLGWEQVPSNISFAYLRSDGMGHPYAAHGVTVYDNFLKLLPMCDEAEGLEWLNQVRARMRSSPGSAQHTVLLVLGEGTEERFPYISSCADWYAGVLYDYEEGNLTHPTLQRAIMHGPFSLETGGWRYAPLRWTRTKGLVLDDDSKDRPRPTSKVLPFPAWARWGKGPEQS